MPQNAQIIAQLGNLPDGFCFQNWQQIYQSFFGITSFYLPGQYSLFNYGSQTPSADDRDKPWFRLNDDGSPDKFYVFFDGTWKSPHPIAASDGERRLYIGTLSELKLKDGGEDAPITTTTGPFWKEDTDFRQRIPIGVGTLPLSGTAIPLLGVGGVDQQTLTDAQMQHLHSISNAHAWVSDIGGAQTWIAFNGTGGAGSVTIFTDAFGGSSRNPVDMMPPYLGCYFIRRTGRVYYSLPG